MAVDLILDLNDDLKFDSNGELMLGETVLQEIGIIARLNKGDLKSDPLLGPNLIELVKRSGSKSEMKQRLRLSLQRDGKNFQELEKYIELIQNDIEGNSIT